MSRSKAAIPMAAAADSEEMLDVTALIVDVVTAELIEDCPTCPDGPPVDVATIGGLNYQTPYANLAAIITDCLE